MAADAVKRRRELVTVSDVNKDLGPKAKAKAKDLVSEATDPHQAQQVATSYLK